MYDPLLHTRRGRSPLTQDYCMCCARFEEIARMYFSIEEQLEALQLQSMGNGHHLYENIMQLQRDLLGRMQALRDSLEELHAFGCELKDSDTGLIDFLSLRDGREIYLCWRLGEERIAFWHDLDAGVAGRQPL